MSEEDNQNEDSYDFKDNEDDEFSEIDDDRPTLIQINRKIEKERKAENKKLMIKKRKRTKNDTDIIYDANKKKLLNCFCPNPEELNYFLENCEIREIKDENELNNMSKENIFDPEQFVKENYKEEECKTYLSMEDLTLKAKKTKFEYPEQLNITEEKSYTSKPENENKTELMNGILNNEILDLNQREELNKLISEIKQMNIKDIIKKDKKLNIVLDLDNTCIFSFCITPDKYKELNKKFPKKNSKLISFTYNGNTIFSCLIIRNGLSEFLDFAKLFCNFYINTLGVESYGIEIMLMLEKMMDIKFKRFKGRKDKKEAKFLKDLELDNKNTIIFDDKPSVWKEDFLNVILSKIFLDKEFQDYFQINNGLNYFLLNYYPFYFYKSEKNDYKQIKWKKQKIFGGRQCPFYKYFTKNDISKNDCYSGEYLESSEFQFKYMKDIIKLIYYFVFYYDIHVPDILKLIRFNVFYKSYFSLSFYKGEGRDILRDIIENCGGEVYEKNENNKNKLIFICRKDDYLSLKDKIKKELIIYENSELANEKYILNSFYFFTNLELKDSEYSMNNENIKSDDFENY